MLLRLTSGSVVGDGPGDCGSWGMRLVAPCVELPMAGITTVSHAPSRLHCKHQSKQLQKQLGVNTVRSDKIIASVKLRIQKSEAT